MKIKNSVYKPTEHGLSYSAISRFMTCRKMAKLVIDGWQPIASSHALRFGSIWHEMQEMMYSLPCVSKKVIPTEDMLLGIKSAIEDKYINSVSVEDADTIYEVENDIAICYMLMCEYVKYHIDDFKKRKWIGMESKFNVNHNGSRLLGYIDARFTVGKEHWIMETKTKSRISGNLVDMLQFDFQSFMYMHGCKLTYGILPKGVLYNIVRKPQIERKKTETIDQFTDRLKNDIKNRPEFYFIRYQVSIPKEEYENWVNNDLNMILNEYKSWEASNFSNIYRNTINCETKFGSCQYLPICAHDDYVLFKNTKENK